MALDVERRWVAWLDSATWRRMSRSPVGSRVLSSAAFRSVDTTRRYVITAVRQAREPAAFASVQTFCLFLGTVKSGGSLVGSLLDAHPGVVLSDEADPLRYVTAGFGREQIFHLLAKTAHREAMKGRVTARRLEPYTLAVPGQSQGRVRAPTVVGDSRAGPTTRRLGDEPALIERLRVRLRDVEDRYIHVVRNPFDSISAMVLRSRRPLPNAIDDYGRQSRRVDMLRTRLGEDRLLTVRYEPFVADPSAELRRVCAFLGLDATADYLAACARIIDPTRRPERERVSWPDGGKAAVELLIDQFPFLEGYAFAR